MLSAISSANGANRSRGLVSGQGNCSSVIRTGVMKIMNVPVVKGFLGCVLKKSVLNRSVMVMGGTGRGFI